MRHLTLLDRDSFRESVFKRDNYKCVACNLPAVDAHHIIERRLWPDGGYYIENGASLCEKHHIEAETTELTCEKLRELIGITKFPIPPHLYDDLDYDKWGNILMPNGLRVPGELADDDSVKKILKGVEFATHFKYPRTYHLPWSPGLTKDDRVVENTRSLEKSNIVVTAKMDGENTTMYNDYIHARSIDYSPHPSRSRVKALHASIMASIPQGWRFCGENLYAKHSIHYHNLDDYFLVFSIWNEKNVCLSWDDTILYSELIGLKTVPVLYRGPWDESMLRRLHRDSFNNDECEGYVVRADNEFHYKDFRNSVAKYVRKNHVQTHGHWMRSEIEPNHLTNARISGTI